MPTNGTIEGGPPGGAGYGGGGGDWIGAVVQAGAGLYDSHQNRKASKENTDKTIAAQKAEAELAYQRSMESWHMQNAYNSPESQMARFQQAGLNPHLIYGQGSSGLASGPPQYQPAQMQHRYEAAPYGSAIASILPTLMSVGTWMQNMRLTEADLKKTEVDTVRNETDTEKMRQLIEYLTQKNPRSLTTMDNALSLFPYQKAFQRDTAEKAFRGVADMEREYQHKWGEKLYDNSGLFSTSSFDGRGTGMRKLEFMQEQSKVSQQASRAKLLEAQSSWSDFDITNPQALMQMVMSGVMGLAGQSIRLSNKPRGSRKIGSTKQTRPGSKTKAGDDHRAAWNANNRQYQREIDSYNRKYGN